MDLLIMVIMFAVLALLMVFITSFFDKQIMKIKFCLRYMAYDYVDQLSAWEDRGILTKKDKLFIDYLELELHDIPDEEEEDENG